MKIFALETETPPPELFVYDSEQPTIETERLSWYLNWIFYHLSQQGFEVRQDENQDYDALHAAIVSWQPTFLSWIDGVKDALENDTDIPKLLTSLAPYVQAGLKSGSIEVLLINVVIQLISNALGKNNAEVGQETGDMGKLTELFEEAFLDTENEDSVLKRGLLSSTTEVFAWLDALQAEGLHITITPQGVSVSYGDNPE